MACSNCYNGCAEIVSDKCVKYTGIDVPVLGIQSGDSLSYVEQALIEFLTAAIDGTGIKIDVTPAYLCELINKYLPDCGELTAKVLFEALIQAACDLQTQVNTINSQLDVLNADYDVNCLSGVTSTSDTHAVLQAVITKLCQVESDLDLFKVTVDATYVKLIDLPGLIQDYLDSITPAVTQQYQKMVPYTVVEYYGDPSNFDGTGKGVAGLGWDKVYLCNGLNGTPDKRGRLPVGAISGVPGGALAPSVNPSTPGGFNPNYTLNYTTGTNSFSITDPNQLPPHSHSAATSIATQTPHNHYVVRNQAVTGDSSNSIISNPNGTIAGRWITDNNDEYDLQGNATPSANAGKTSDSTISMTFDTTIGTTGSNAAIGHIPPVLACYYIMYIP